MEVEHPVYRVTWGANPGVIEGKAGVLAFYNSVGEAVLWHSDDRLAVADWGICDEITFRQLAEGAILKWRGAMGATDPAKAAPGSIRRDLGTSIGNNCTHGSDAPETAVFELGYFFAGYELI